MKHNRWLIILVSILLIINIAIFILIRYGELDLYFKNLVISYIEQKLHIDIDIEHLSFNDKQLFANQIRVNHQKDMFHLTIEQLHIDYNILNLFFFKSKSVNTISGIRIYKPTLILKIDSIEKSNNSKIMFPELYEYFRYLDLFNGEIKIIFDNEFFNYEKSIKHIDIQIANDNNITIAQISIEDSTSLFLNANLKKAVGQKPILKMEGRNFQINNLELLSKGLFSSEVNFSLNTEKNFDYYLSFSNNSLLFKEKKYENISIYTDSLVINGNQDKLFFESGINTTKSDNLEFFNGVLAHFNGSVLFPFDSSKTNFIANIFVEKINLPLEFFAKNNKVSANLILHGNYNNIELNSKLYSSQLNFSYKISDKFQINDIIDDLEISIKSKNILTNAIEVKIKKGRFLNTQIRGIGKWDYKIKDFDFFLFANNVSFNFQDKSDSFNFNIKSNARFNYSDVNKKHFESNSTLNTTKININSYRIDIDEIKINSLNNQVDFVYKAYEEGISGFAKIDLSKQKYMLDMNLNHFNLSNMNQNYPDIIIKTSLNVKKENNQIEGYANLTTGDVLIKDNFFNMDLYFHYDIVMDSLRSKLRIFDSFINYTPFYLAMEAKGNNSFLNSTYFNINDMIDIDFSLDLNNDKTTGFKYKLDLRGNEIEFDSIMPFILNRNLAKEFQGKLDISLTYDNTSSKKNPLFVDLSVMNFQYFPFQNFDIKTSGSGDWKNLRIDKFQIFHESIEFINAVGEIVDYGNNISLSSFFESDISKLLIDSDIKGTIKSNFDFKKKNDEVTAKFSASSNTIKYRNRDLGNFDIDVNQFNEKLEIKKFDINAGVDLRANIRGSLNYNIFTDKIYPLSDSLYLKIRGNPVRYFQDFTDIIVGGSSSFFADAYIYMHDEGLVFNNGKILMKDSWVKFLTQQENLDNIIINGKILNNSLIFDQFEAKMGRGKIFIRNEISTSEENFVLANLNFGKFFVRTDDIGLLFHLPLYMAHESVANAVIRGRNSKEAIISGPFDDIRVVADIEFFNGNGIYPSKTENLLKMFDFLRTEIKSVQQKNHFSVQQESVQLPINLDLYMIFTKNCRYVTYPMNLLANPGGYLHLLYNEDGWFAYEANFRAEEGTLELFGTLFNTDYAEVRLNPYEIMPTIYGAFYKKVADGTTITLEIYTDKTGEQSIWDSFKIKLKSDNSNDRTTTQILAKLRYGKSLEELSDAQYQNIFQDEAIHLLGVSVGTALLDPYISPIENKIRRFLRLDNLSINPGFIQNLISERTWDEKYRSDNYISNFSSNILLNNLSVQFGKYIKNNYYLEYELLFQESTDLANKTDIFLYQTIGLRVDLPYRFKVRYSYELNPKREKNAHEVFFMRSFKF